MKFAEITLNLDLLKLLTHRGLKFVFESAQGFQGENLKILRLREYFGIQTLRIEQDINMKIPNPS